MSNTHHAHETSHIPARHIPLHQRKRVLLLIAVPLLAGFIGVIFYLLGGRYVETDNAYIKAQKVPVSASVAGAVKEVLVQENQAVQSGQVLFRFDQTPFQIAVAKDEARLGQVRNDLAALRTATVKNRPRLHWRVAIMLTQSGNSTGNPIWRQIISFPRQNWMM